MLLIKTLSKVNDIDIYIEACIKVYRSVVKHTRNNKKNNKGSLNNNNNNNKKKTIQAH